jgi:hypothetical protein
MTPERAAAVAALRRHIAEVAPHRPTRRLLPTGIALLDERVGGFGALTAISGAAGTGRCALVLPAIRALTRSDSGRQGRTVAVVDVRGWFHPPGLSRVDLSRVLLVRPGPERALWAAEQLARSTAVALVVVLDLPRQGRAGRRLLSAAESGRTPVVILQEERDLDLPAGLCLAMTTVEGERAVVISRDPMGHAGGALLQIEGQCSP